METVVCPECSAMVVDLEKHEIWHLCVIVMTDQARYAANAASQEARAAASAAWDARETRQRASP